MSNLKIPSVDQEQHDESPRFMTSFKFWPKKRASGLVWKLCTVELGTQEQIGMCCWNFDPYKFGQN